MKTTPIERLYTMNWKRGLFRLWLIAAVIWMACVGALTWKTLLPSTEAEGTFLLPSLREERAIENAHRWIAIAVMAGPPIATYLIGYSLLWAFQGFRRNL